MARLSRRAYFAGGSTRPSVPRIAVVAVLALIVGVAPTLPSRTSVSWAAGPVAPAVWSAGDNEAWELGRTDSFDPEGFVKQQPCAEGCSSSGTPEAIGGLTDVTALAAGDLFGLAMKSDGTVWAWGYNRDGELGNGSTADSATPVQVSGLSGVVAVAAGAWAGYAVKSDGTLWSWGLNSNGQLGLGSTSNALTPTKVTALSGVTGVAGTNDAAVAVTSSGAVWSWGRNTNGELCASTKSVTQRTSPAQVSGITSVRSVAAALDNWVMLFIRTDGSLWGCGNNQQGQNGGTSSSVTVPTQVTGVSGVTQAASDGSQSWALTPGGVLWTWGGWDCAPNGTTCHTPHRDVLSNVTAIAAGSDNLLAIRGGTLWGSGSNADNQLGLNAMTSPYQLIGKVANASLVAVGFEDWYAGGATPPKPYSPPPSPPVEQSYGDASAASDFAPRAESTQADPVNSATGAFSTSDTDVALPGTGLGIAWSRTYTSNDSTGTGDLGPGWSDSYSARLDVGSSDVVLHTDDGQQVHFTANADGSYSGAYGATARLSHNGDGSYTVTTHDELRYAFDASGVLTAIADRNGQGPVLSRNLTGAISSVTAAGRTVAVSHDPTTGLLSTVTLSDGRYVAYSYTAGRLTDVRNLDGTHTTYGYDSAGRLNSITDGANDQVVRLIYDSTSGRVTDEYDADNQHTTFAWDPGTQTSAMTDPRGHVWTDAYAGTVLLSQTDPDGNTTAFQYDAQYRLVATTDPAGYTTRETYDSTGNITDEVTADGATYHYTFDALNDETSSTSPTGITVSYGYDSRGNLVSTTRPNPAGSTAITTTFTRDPVTGLVSDSYDARGKKTHYDYDSAGDRIDVITPLGNKTTWTYDNFGRVTSEVAPRGNVAGANADDYRTSYSYDAEDRLLTVTDPLNHAAVVTNSYDAVGDLLTRTDAKGRVTTWTYDPAGHVTTVQPPTPIAATAYGYDADGNLAQLTRPGNRVTTYSYDAANRLTSTTSALGTWTFDYDTADNRTGLTDPAGYRVAFGYDPLHRLTAVSYPSDTPSVAYGYDLDGNRLVMSDGAGTTTYAYDALDRLTSVSRGSQTFSYAYDAAGELTASTDPGQPTNSYSYDDDGRLSSVTTGAISDASYGYDADGHLTSTLLGDGYNETRAWDRDDRLTNITDVKSGTVLTRAGYTYDATNNPVSMVNAAGATTIYSYDVLDRLTAACFNTTSCTGASDYVKYSYDDIGNRLTETRPAGTTTYTYNAGDELTQTSGPNGTTAYGYDVDGDRTSAGTSTYTYNHAGRITSQKVGNTTTTYTYDGDGRRLSTTAGNATTNFLWDPATYQLAAETDASGTTLRRYTYGAGLINMTVPGSKPATYYYHVDGQGSPLAVTDSTGATQWTYTWEPYGAAKSVTKATSSAPTNPRQWLTEYANADGTYNLRARQYDPSVGDFTSIDPAGTADAYGYAADNPLVNVDPLGESWWHSAISIVHSAAEVVSSVAAIAAVATAPIAPVSAALGAVALGAGAVAAGTGIALAVDACTSSKGSCAGAIVNAALDLTNSMACLGVARELATGARMQMEVAEDGVSLSLKYRQDWTGAQRAAADAKVGALNEAAGAGTLRVTQVERSGTSAASRYRRAGGEIPAGSDVDHMIDLQLGGSDDVSNMSPLDLSVNRSLGAQISSQLRDVPPGTCVIRVTIC